MAVKIWHNELCSTSNKAKDALSEVFGEDLEVRDYLKYPPSIKEIKEVLSKMNQKASYIIRKNDKVYKDKFEGNEMTDEEWIKSMSAHPSIIERPIIITETKAHIARPINYFMETILPTIV